MSIVERNRIAKSEALKAYHDTCFSLETAHRAAMNKMLDMLRESGKPMTAEQIKQMAKETGLSKMEIIGNLRAMYYNRSRLSYAPFLFGKRLNEVSVPYGESGCRDWGYGGTRAERNGILNITSGRCVTKTFAELDENGEVIPYTTFTKEVCQPDLYGIESADAPKSKKSR